jgi:hypothetical protein
MNTQATTLNSSRKMGEHAEAEGTDAPSMFLRTPQQNN